jgi:hypothetical protein
MKSSPCRSRSDRYLDSVSTPSSARAHSGSPAPARTSWITESRWYGTRCVTPRAQGPLGLGVPLCADLELDLGYLSQPRRAGRCDRALQQQSVRHRPPEYRKTRDRHAPTGHLLKALTECRRVHYSPVSMLGKFTLRETLRSRFPRLCNPILFLTMIWFKRLVRGLSYLGLLTA